VQSGAVGTCAWYDGGPRTEVATAVGCGARGCAGHVRSWSLHLVSFWDH
jgi:hypothetical protein